MRTEVTRMHLEARTTTWCPTWPLLCVAQHYYPGRATACYPGFLLVQESAIWFFGAGERLLECVWYR
jgi:hypothetical protein